MGKYRKLKDDIVTFAIKHGYDADCLGTTNYGEYLVDFSPINFGYAGDGEETLAGEIKGRIIAIRTFDGFHKLEPKK